MCTLVVIRGYLDDFPLIIAANRDERPARPAEPPRMVRPDVFAPTDLKGGGTWIGVNRAGLAVAITNRDAGPHKGKRSRGLLVSDVLALAKNLDDAERMLDKLEPTNYSGFHVVVADGASGYLFVNDGQAITQTDIAYGVNVYTSFGTEKAHCPRASRLEREVNRHVISNDAKFSSLLGLHCDEPVHGTCVHGDGVHMESRSSMIIRHDTKHWRVRWRDGRPCARGEWHDETVKIRR